jgi:hypothetical protein
MSNLLKPLRALPLPIRSVLIDCNAWVVGSGALWFLGKLKEPPRDFDIIVPPGSWMTAARIVNSKFLAMRLNSFGGLKLSVTAKWRLVEELEIDNAPSNKKIITIDLWPQHLEDFFMHTPKVKKSWAVRIVPRSVICELLL